MIYYQIDLCWFIRLNDKDRESRSLIVSTLEKRETPSAGDIILNNCVRIIIPNNFASVTLSSALESVRSENDHQLLSWLKPKGFGVSSVDERVTNWLEEVLHDITALYQHLVQRRKT